MAPDTYQTAWQAQASETRVTVDADLLLREVQRNQAHLRGVIFWRDLREVGIALVMLPVWIYLGVSGSLPWSWYLAVPAFLWVAAFIVVDRLRHKRNPWESEEPLLESVRESLTQVEHQIWLLRNIVWWYLMPFAVPIIAFFAQVAWRNAEGWLAFATAFGLPSLFVLALYYLIYCLNQRAVRTQLEPRRRELLSLIESLGDETSQDQTAGGEEPAEKTGILNRLLILACLGFVAYMAFGLISRFGEERTEGVGYPRLSPFAAVRWQDARPEVEVGGKWYELVSLDGVPADQIVAFSRRTYGGRWRQRFEEDLVELLSRMGHPPQESVKLVVRAAESEQTQVLDGVPLTAENREAIKRAAEARAKSP